MLETKSKALIAIIITMLGIVANFAGLNWEFGGLKCILACSDACVIVQTVLW